MSIAVPAASKSPSQLFPWLVTYLPHITQSWGQNGETGVDLGTPYGTPITSLTYGSIENFGFYGGGGVVSVHSKIDGKDTTVYYQHLDVINSALSVGQAIIPGDLLGWSGGQLSGGYHPVTCCSSGPHTEVGRDVDYGGIWGKQYQQNSNPVPWLQRLVNGDVSAQGVYSPGSPTDAAGNQLQNMFSPFVPQIGSGAITGQDDWPDFCINLESAEIVVNPFEGQNLDFNPVDGAPGLGILGNVLWIDAKGIFIRAAIILLGFMIAARVILSIIPVQQIIENAEQGVEKAGAAGAMLV